MVAQLEELHRKDQVGARFVPPQNWHVTLRFFGSADVGAVAAALDGGRFRTAEIRLGPAVDVGGGRTLFVPVTGADELAAEVVRVAGHLGTEPVRRPFRGHVTIARVKKGANMPRSLGELVEATWTGREVALVESTLRPDGARYTTIHTWPTTA